MTKKDIIGLARECEESIAFIRARIEEGEDVDQESQCIDDIIGDLIKLRTAMEYYED